MKVKDLVPTIYYKESRDFSAIGRLFEVAFNYLKTNVDLVGQDPINNEVPDVIIDLLALTLGFESKHKYQTKDLVAICSSLSHLLKCKGTSSAIEEAITILLSSQGITESFDIDYDTNDPCKLIIYVPSVLEDTILLEDLFEYILPVGMTYTFQIKSKGSGSYEMPITISDEVKPYIMGASQLAQVSGDVDDSFSNVDEDAYGQDANRSMIYTSVVPGGESQEDESNEGGN